MYIHLVGHSITQIKIYFEVYLIYEASNICIMVLKSYLNLSLHLMIYIGSPMVLGWI